MTAPTEPEPTGPEATRPGATGAGATRPEATGSPLRILWLIKGLGPGGAEQLIVHQARARDRAGFAVEAAYLVPWKDHHVPALVAEGVRVTPLHAPRDLDPRWLLRLRRLLVRGRFDVVHTHSPIVAAAVRVVARTVRPRPALVTTEHNRWPRHTRATRLANRLTFALDDRHLAVSDDVRDTVPERGRTRVEPLVHGTDLGAARAAAAHRDAMRAELGVGPDDVVVGIVANFRREKAYEVLLAAADRAVAADPRLRFVSVGQGPLEDEMRAVLAGLSGRDRITLLGYRDDPLRVMSAFDVFTLTSRHEGLPVALMDALALGLPIVATAVGGIPQAVTDGVEARLVSPAGAGDRADAGVPGDPGTDDDRVVRELADAYVALAADPGLRRRMGDAAATASAGFDIARATRRIEAVYLEAAAGRERSGKSSR